MAKQKEKKHKFYVGMDLANPDTQDILVFTVGDPKSRFYPSKQDMENIQTMVTEALKKPPTTLFFPWFVKVKKIKLGGKKVKNCQS